MKSSGRSIAFQLAWSMAAKSTTPLATENASFGPAGSGRYHKRCNIKDIYPVAVQQTR